MEHDSDNDQYLEALAEQVGLNRELLSSLQKLPPHLKAVVNAVLISQHGNNQQIGALFASVAGDTEAGARLFQEGELARARSREVIETLHSRVDGEQP